ncbi:ribonuclease 2-5A family protein, partial [Musa troglodytarum]
MLPSPRSVVFYAVLAIGFLVSGVLTPVVLEPSASPYPGLSFPVASTGEISAAEKWSDRLLSTDLVPVEKSPPGVLRAGSRSLMSLDENKHGRFFLALPNGTIYFMNKSTKPQWKLLIAKGNSTNIARDIVSGIAHLHELGIIHRDLKPQNVLISNDRHLYAKLSDMGISKRLLEDMSSLSRNATALVGKHLSNFFMNAKHELWIYSVWVAYYSFVLPRGNIHLANPLNEMQTLLTIAWTCSWWIIYRKLSIYFANYCNETLGPVPEGFDMYFTSRFPKLLIEVYKVVYYSEVSMQPIDLTNLIIVCEDNSRSSEQQFAVELCKSASVSGKEAHRSKEIN